MILSRLRTKKGIAATMATVAIAAGGAIAAVQTAGPAVAFFSPPLLLEIQVQSATVVAKGAGVDVAFQVECAGTRRAFVDFSLNERFGKDIANGYGEAQVTCTDSPQTIVVLSAAEPTPFKPGTALLQSDIFGCTRRFCADQTDNETIKIVKK